MKFRIVEIQELSGDACKIYTIVYDGEEDSLFECFQDRMDAEGFSAAVDEVWYTLRFMGKEGGARIQFFKEDEGKPGDGIVALLKKKKFTLRLYCIRYGSGTLVLGDGGYKPSTIRAWQDDDHLKACVHELMRISALITERIKSKEIMLSADGSLTGDLTFDDEA